MGEEGYHIESKVSSCYSMDLCLSAFPALSGPGPANCRGLLFEEPAPSFQTLPADRYVESVNNVSGSFTVDGIFNHDKKPYSVNVTQAYASVVKNPEDQSKREVLIVLLEKPLPRFALAVAENPDAEAAAEEFDEVLHNRDARGVFFACLLEARAAA